MAHLNNLIHLIYSVSYTLGVDEHPDLFHASCITLYLHLHPTCMNRNGALAVVVVTLHLRRYRVIRPSNDVIA
jgi:hypothetical protein